MSLWNYIGEFFLFRWFFGKFKMSTTEHDVHIKSLRPSIDRDNKSLSDNHNEDIAQFYDVATPVGDNLIDDFDNIEALDDLDKLMRDNKGNDRSYQNYGIDYHSSGHYSNHRDWRVRSYSQSYDDFHDEQDDYDMMDDDF